MWESKQEIRFPPNSPNQEIDILKKSAMLLLIQEKIEVLSDGREYALCFGKSGKRFTDFDRFVAIDITLNFYLSNYTSCRIGEYCHFKSFGISIPDGEDTIKMKNFEDIWIFNKVPDTCGLWKRIA